MAKVETVDVTPQNGATEFPVNDNDTMDMVETIASQTIRGAKSGNIVEDAFYEYEVDKGAVVEEAVIKMAEKQAFDKNAFDKTAKDPVILTKYFNNWEQAQYQTTTRRDEIRKILKEGGSVEQVAGDIVDTLTQGDNADDFITKRKLLLNSGFAKDYKTIIGGVPLNMKGVIYAMRNMYNHLKTNNSDLTSDVYVSATPVEDIRVAIPRDVLDLIDIVELANIFNLSKEEILGKIVIVDTSDVGNEDWKYNVVVYDRKAMGRGTRLYEYESERVAKGRYDNHYLTVDRMYFFNGLFKTATINCKKAVTEAKAQLIGAEQ